MAHRIERNSQNHVNFSKEIRHQIVSDYLAGESGTKIAARMGVSFKLIYRVLAAEGIMLRSSRKLSSEKSRWAAEQYIAGKSSPELAKELGLSPRAVVCSLSRSGVQMRTASEAKQKYHCRHDAFQVITDAESAYWVGFIMADGCVTELRGSWSLRVAIAESDASHLKKLSTFLCSDRPIGVYSNNRHWKNCQKIAHFSVKSNEIAADLARYGVVPRKSATAQAVDGVQHMRCFWRGCIDGDGWMGWSNTVPRMGLVGSRQLLVQFAEYCEAKVGVGMSVMPMHNIWSACVTGAKAVAMVRHFYRSDDVALDRKARHAAEIAEWKPRKTLSAAGRLLMDRQ